ncbi:MAG: hypothetical protein CUN52_03015 [Phototrophicales bacterium]|nr:MAG: hypothetical protein CUN52_03015 [Phototrophicales bacterium]
MRWIFTICLFISFVLPHTAPTLSQSESASLTILHTERITHAQWSADESHILTTSEDGTIRMSHAQTGNIVWERSHNHPIAGASWHENMIIAWDTNGTALLINAITGEVTDRYYLDQIQNAIWAGDNTTVMIYSPNILNLIAIQDGLFGTGLFALETPDPILSAQWNTDATRIFTFHQSLKTIIWDVDRGDAIGSYQFAQDTTGIAWSMREDQLVSWGANSTITLWHISSTTGMMRVRDFRHSRTFVIGTKWAMDDNLLITWGADETARIWDVMSGTEQIRVRHTDWVTGAMINHDGTKLVTWSYHFAYLWNAQTGELIWRVSQDNLVSGAMLNADETRLLTWGWDGTARVWDISITDAQIQMHIRDDRLFNQAF